MLYALGMNSHQVYAMWESPFGGLPPKMMKVGEPSNPERVNFVIQWQGRDWSNFRTLAECKSQFAELEAKGGPYTVVER